MKTFDGLIPPEQRAAFNEQFIGGAVPFFSYATEKCAIDGILAAAHFFTPDFTLIGDCVFLTAIMPPDFNEESYREMEQRYHGDHSAMERWVNAWSVGGISSMPIRNTWTMNRSSPPLRTVCNTTGDSA
jgi:hypothetical protein